MTFGVASGDASVPYVTNGVNASIRRKNAYVTLHTPHKAPPFANHNLDPWLPIPELE